MYLSFASIAGKHRSNYGADPISSDVSDSNPGPVAAQLAAIAAQFESLKGEVAALKFQREKPSNGSGSGRFGDEESFGRQHHQYHCPTTKITFPSFSNGDPQEWIRKAYFKFYDIVDDDKVDVASMHLDGEALDLYSWLSVDQPIAYWEDLVHALQKIFGPAKFQNQDEFLCKIKQTGSVQEYLQEFAK